MKKLLSWVLPLTTVIVIIAASALVLYPWVQDVLAKREEIPQKQARLGKLVSKVKTLNTLNEEQISRYLLDIEVVLPSDPQPPLALASLETLAGNAGLSVGSVQYTGVEENVVAAELSAGGEYNQITDFLANLQNSSPLLQVKSFKLSQEKSEDEDGENSVQNSAVVQAAAPYQAIVDDLGEIESQVNKLSGSEKETLEKAQALETLLKPVDESDVEAVDKGKENPFQ